MRLQFLASRVPLIRSCGIRTVNDGIISKRIYCVHFVVKLERVGAPQAPSNQLSRTGMVFDLHLINKLIRKGDIHVDKPGNRNVRFR